MNSKEAIDEDVLLEVGLYNRGKKINGGSNFLNFRDSTLNYILKNKTRKIFHRDSIKSSSGSYFVKKNDIGNLVFYNYKEDSSYIYILRKMTKRPLPKIRKKILKATWEETISSNSYESFSIKKTYSFDYPLLDISKQYYHSEDLLYKETEHFTFDTLSIGSNRFIYWKNDHFFSLNQIEKMTENQLNLVNQSEIKESRHNLRLSESIDLDMYNTFKMCQREGLAFQYYQSGRIKPNGMTRKELIDSFNEDYIHLDGVENKGYIRIRFVVNCEGKIGRFSIQELDFNYTKQRFDKRIAHQIFNKLINMDSWERKFDRQNNKQDYYIHITFKINNGKIEDILP